jgi:type-F conjugative transfer system pilin assembly protein TrbC
VLRLLTVNLALLCCAAAAVAADRPMPAASSTSALATSRKILQDAGKLSMQKHFKSSLAGDRAALDHLAIPSAPRIQTGQSRPAPRDLFNAISKGAGDAPKAWSADNLQPPVLLVSMSIPLTELRALARQAARIGAPLVLRGLVDDSFPKTERTISQFKDIPGVSFMVDPTLFERFGVTAVPAFVLPLSALTTCSPGAGCPRPDFVKVSGDAGLGHDLAVIRDQAADPRARALATRLEAMLEARK